MYKLCVAFLALGLLLLSACGGTNSSGAAGSATIQLGVGQFITTSATIKAGQAVTFDDTNGGPHNLVTGSMGTFTQEAGAPSQFVQNGIPFNAGQVTTITFPTAGTYMITCTLHPSMEATITVTS
jgi:plastocyanin